MKPTLNTFLLAPVLAFIATTAHGQAQDPASATATPAATETARAALVSRYLTRGVQHSWDKPAAQIGFSAGSWSSRLGSKTFEDGAREWDLYGGYSGSISDIGYSAVVYYYIYPGAKISAANVKYDYGELSLGVNYKIFSAKYNHAITKDYFGFTDARGTGYIDLGANIDIGSGYGLQLHYGMGRVRNWPDYDWRDYKIALTRSFSNGWMAIFAVTKGNAASGVYDSFPATTPNSSGVPEAILPLKTNAVISVSKSF